MNKQRRLFFLAGMLVIILVVLAIGNLGESEIDPEQYKKELRESRAAKDKELKNSAESAIPAAQRVKFDGLDYYPPDLSFRVRGTYAAKTGAMGEPLVAGNNVVEPAGEVSFELKDQDYTFRAYYNRGPEQKDELFIPFTDKTNGSTTYGGGRYLNANVDGNQVVLDFNRAYNPTCAYNPTYLCVMPPKQNRLRVAAEVGEKSYPLAAY